MNIETKFFGDIEIGDEDILNFPDGIFGFEDERRYVLIDIENQPMFKVLQSVDTRELAFLVVNPWYVLTDYRIDLDDDELISFGDNDINNFLVYSIVTISEDKITANLMGPVLLNIKTCIGKQVVLHNSSYTTKHIIKLFEKKE